MGPSNNHPTVLWRALIAADPLRGAVHAAPPISESVKRLGTHWRGEIYDVKRIIIALLVFFAFLATVEVGLQGPADAYTFNGCKMSAPNIKYFNKSSYTDAVSSAITSWNDTNTPITFFAGTSANHDVQILNINYGNTGYDGITNYSCSGSYFTKVNSNFNVYYTASYTRQARRQVMTHELGHALGLGHAGTSTCSGQPIMYYTSDRYFVCGHINPQQDDVVGVNARY